MLKVKQKYEHNPETGTYGDCQRAAIASLMNIGNIEKVPHFFEGGPDTKEFYYRLRKWLAQNGLGLVEIAYDADSVESAMYMFSRANPGITYMLYGKSNTGTNHAVIAQDDEIIWDPSERGGKIVAPCDPSGQYVIALLVPLFHYPTGQPALKSLDKRA